MGQNYTLITGAASGFGRNIAKRLAPSRNLVLSDLNSEKLATVRDECAGPERHLLWVRDLDLLDGISHELNSLLVEKDIAIDHFVHSAGVFGVQFVRVVEPDFMTRMFNVNVFSSVEIIRALTQKKSNKGALRSIVFISSINSRLGAKGYSIYAASKGAVNALSLSLAVELAPAVRVNAVLPGIIETEMNHEHFSDPAFVASMEATHPLGLGRPDDISGAVEFLTSDRARWITGQEIVVDGGRLASK